MPRPRKTNSEPEYLELDPEVVETWQEEQRGQALRCVAHHLRGCPQFTAEKFDIWYSEQALNWVLTCPCGQQWLAGNWVAETLGISEQSLRFTIHRLLKEIENPRTTVWEHVLGED